MEVEKFRGYVAAVVAAACVIGGTAGAIFVWLAANDTTPPRELALIFGVMTSIIGSGSTFLFMADSAARAAHASERAFTSGSITGAQLPDQASTIVPLEPLRGDAVVSDTAETPADPTTDGR